MANSLSIGAISKVNEDIDPLIDISVTVEIKQIRSLEKFDSQTFTFDTIDFMNEPDFYVKVLINDEEFTSPIWYDTKYVYDPQWSATLNVPDDEDDVDIKIQLWDWNKNGDKLCDISPFNYDLPDDYDVELYYNIETGHWRGDFETSLACASSHPWPNYHPHGIIQPWQRRCKSTSTTWRTARKCSATGRPSTRRCNPVT